MVKARVFRNEVGICKAEAGHPPLAHLVEVSAAEPRMRVCAARMDECRERRVKVTAGHVKEVHHVRTLGREHPVDVRLLGTQSLLDLDQSVSPGQAPGGTMGAEVVVAGDTVGVADVALLTVDMDMLRSQVHRASAEV